MSPSVLFLAGLHEIALFVQIAELFQRFQRSHGGLTGCNKGTYDVLLR